MDLRKFFIAGAMALGLVTVAFAQDWATAEGSCFSKGNMQGTFGLNVYAFGPNLGFDVAINDAISVGGGIGFGFTVLTYDIVQNQVPIVGRAAFHPFNLKAIADKMPMRDKLDPYVGVGVGYRIWWRTNDFVGSGIADPWNFIFRERIGVTYYFAPNIYVNAEEGGGLGGFSIGIGMKF